MGPEEVSLPRPERCRSCQAWIWKLRGPSGNYIPVQKVTQLYKAQRMTDGTFEVVKAGQETYFINHFQTCPDAERFSKRQRREGS